MEETRRELLLMISSLEQQVQSLSKERDELKSRLDDYEGYAYSKQRRMKNLGLIPRFTDPC